MSEFRDDAHRVADRVADYLERIESFRVVPRISPGEIRAALPEHAPDEPESFETILDDYSRLIEPNITHWQHPKFMAYFSSVAAEPAILGEWLATALNSNVMFWKNAPASTELEERIVQWLREMLGLPEGFDGMFTDTASISSLLSLTAARHVVPGLDSRRRGLCGRDGDGALRVYVSEEAHMSIAKAAIVIGVGLEHVVSIATDAELRMDPRALARSIAADRATGHLPFCVVATLGTTSSNAIDPAAAIAEVCERERLWFHIDAAYGGAAALLDEYRPLFAGWERADSIVVNPHKWMFTPFDASLLLFRRPEVFRETFSIVPEYLSGSAIEGAHNFNEYGIQLGRRFRALKIWFLIRAWGVRGIAEKIREHCAMARELARRIEAEPGWELLAPVPLATVCFRHLPPQADGEESVEQANVALLDRLHRDSSFYLSPTRLRGRFSLRVTFGNPRQTAAHLDGVWDALCRAARAV